VDHPGTKRRFLDGRFPTPTGRAHFLPRDHREPRELPDHEFPLVLTTGRLYSHWHTLTRTAKAAKLVHREPGPFVEVNPADAARLDLKEGELVQLSSRRGTVQLPARLRDGVAPGMVFVPFHWGDLYSPGNSANYLTISAIGRVAKQPELKFCAVQLEKIPVHKHEPQFSIQGLGFIPKEIANEKEARLKQSVNGHLGRANLSTAVCE
jgi:anaerobic selenocysteine-containing dehydrogenase